MDKLVSIIIPSFNKAKFIDRTINSVLYQSYKNIEVIVVDDCSTDNSIQILNKFKDKIKLFINNKNYGASYCRNFGLSKSHGQFIAFLDCDDYYDKSKIYECINYINKKNCSFVYTNVNLINYFGKILPNFNNMSKIGEGNISKNVLLNEISITNSTLVAKRECFNKVGGFDENIFLAADREMLVRLSLEYTAGYIEKPLSYYRVYTNNMFENINNTINEFVYILNKHKKNEILKDKNFYKTCLCNIYYNYSKYYIMMNEFKKSKLLLFKIIKIKLNYKKIHMVFTLMILIYLLPNFTKKKLKTRYNQ